MENNLIDNKKKLDVDLEDIEKGSEKTERKHFFNS